MTGACAAEAASSISLELFGDALPVEVGDVGPGAVESALQLVSLPDEVVPFSDQVLVRIADPVAVDLHPGTLGLPGLAHEVGNEPALTGQFP